MIEWKEKAFDTLLKIDRNTKVPKKIIKRVHNIITVMCAHCRVLYPNFNIYCYDKSLEVFPLADESGIELDHIFNSSVRSEAHFEILLNEQNKIICNTKDEIDILIDALNHFYPILRGKDIEQ